MTFFESLKKWLEETKGQDRSSLIAQCIYVDLPDVQLRLWGGIGKAYTPDDQGGWHEWLGWKTKEGSVLEVPNIADVRNGTSEQLEIRLGYLDSDTFNALKADTDQVKGRKVILSKIFFSHEGATRTTVPVGDSEILHIEKMGFKQSMERAGDATVFKRSLSVFVKNINRGRSRNFFGSLNDTQQRERSKLIYDVDNDQYGQWTSLIQKGYIIVF